MQVWMNFTFKIKNMMCHNSSNIAVHKKLKKDGYITLFLACKGFVPVICTKWISGLPDDLSWENHVGW